MTAFPFLQYILFCIANTNMVVILMCTKIHQLFGSQYMKHALSMLPLHFVSNSQMQLLIQSSRKFQIRTSVFSLEMHTLRYLAKASKVDQFHLNFNGYGERDSHFIQVVHTQLERITGQWLVTSAILFSFAIQGSVPSRRRAQKYC